MNRYDISRSGASTLFAVILLVALLSLSSTVRASEDAGPPVEADTAADVFVGERLTYEIGFWIFENVAVCDVTLERGEEDGVYIATLNAYTTGMVDSVIQHRQDVYTSELVLSPDGTRFITKSFKKAIDINGRIRYGNTYVDYGNRVVTWMSWGGGKDEKSGGAAFPEGYYPDDPLAAFYNFRLGAYGPARMGGEYRIPTFPKEDRIPEIFMRIFSADEMERRKAGDGDYMAHVKIDKELFSTGKEGLEIIFSGDLIPLRAVAKDVAFFGDVRGKLVGIGTEASFTRTGSKEAFQAVVSSER